MAEATSTRKPVIGWLTVIAIVAIPSVSMWLSTNAFTRSLAWCLVMPISFL